MSFFRQIFSARRRVYANCLSACTVSAKTYMDETSPYRKWYGNPKIDQGACASDAKKKKKRTSSVFESNYTCKCWEPFIYANFVQKKSVYTLWRNQV
jgi:hypothetical protein